MIFIKAKEITIKLTYYGNSSMFDNFHLGEGYDAGQPPETLVNVTVVPMVMEVLQVLKARCNQLIPKTFSKM